MIWSLAALAAPSTVEVGLQLHGHAATQRTRSYAGVGALVAYRHRPMFAVELSGQWNPNLSRGAWKDGLTPSPLETGRVVSQQWAAQVLAVFSPIQGRFVHGIQAPFAVDAGIGFGLTGTVDDLEALNVDPSDPDADPATSTASQVHPTLAWKAGPRLGIGKHYQIGLYVAGTHWVETIESLTLQPMHQLQGTAMVGRNF